MWLVGISVKLGIDLLFLLTSALDNLILGIKGAEARRWVM